MIYDDDGCWWEGVPILVEDIIASAGNYNNNYTFTSCSRRNSVGIQHMNNIEKYNIILYDFRSSGGSSDPS